MTADDLSALASDPSRPELTRRAAREALDALTRVDTRLRLDAGAATGVVPAAGDDGVRATWRLR